MSTSTPRYCDGLPRRDMLRIGAAGLIGSSLPWAQLLAKNNDTSGSRKGPVSLIYLFLKGGLSTIDTFDMKPDAPEEFRGEFSPAPTKTPGMEICDLLPRMAMVSDKYSLIRSFGHRSSDHGPGDHYMLTGYHTGAGFNPNLRPNNQRPAFGSIIAKKLGPNGSVPPYVCLPRMHSSAGSAYLGASYMPFAVEADPSAPNFSVPDLVAPFEVPADRLDARRELLAGVDRFRKQTEIEANRKARMLSTFQQQALDLMTSPSTKAAFNIHDEPAALRDAYGRHSLGQSCLMARRLVEAGVRCVTIDHTNWDTHDNNFATLKDQLLPMLDSGVSTLFKDLEERGLLESTLVLVTGEFGRTPRINKNAGRDHWAPLSTLALAGGGLRMGQVVGESDSKLYKPQTEPIRPQDLMATIFHVLGIDTKQQFFNQAGRPVFLIEDGKPIKELV